MVRQPAATHWMIIVVLFFSKCLDARPASVAGARVTWPVTWSPDTELHHLAVDSVSDKVIISPGEVLCLVARV